MVNVEYILSYDQNVMTYQIMKKLCPESPWNEFKRGLSTLPRILDTVKVSKSIDIGI